MSSSRVVRSLALLSCSIAALGQSTASRADEPSPTPDPAPARPAAPSPRSAAAALDQAAAAYEYGDLAVMIDSARLVTEGALPASVEERADGLRFLGIGLYLTGRLDGAQLAFEQLLALRPDARLDATTTRPEVVAFFGEVRRRDDQRRRAEAAASKRYAWNFLPPAGQFQNGDRVKGAVILGAEALAIGGALTSYFLLRSWCDGGATNVCPGHQSSAGDLRTFNHAAVGVAIGVYAIGVLDAMLSYDRGEPGGGERPSAARPHRTAARFVVTPTAAMLSLRF